MTGFNIYCGLSPVFLIRVVSGLGKRYLFWFCTSFVATAAVWFLSNTALAFLCMWMLFLLPVVTFLCMTENRFSASLVLIAAVLSFMYLCYFIAEDALPRSFFAKSEITAEVASYPGNTDSGKYSFDARIDYNGKKIKALVYSDFVPDSLSPGDTVHMQAKLYELENTRYFAEKTYYKSRYTDTVMFAENVVILSDSAGIKLRYVPQFLAKYFKDKIGDIYNERSSPLVNSLIMGDRSGLSEDFRNNLSVTGMSHAISVSGLHISFILGLFLYFSKNKYIKLAVQPLVFLFVLMVGAPQSALRAFIMQMFVVFSDFGKREYDQITALSFSAFLLCVLNPYCVTDSAFLLSFAATLGIIVLYPKLRELFECLTVHKKSYLRKLTVGMVSVAAVSVSATVFTAPLTAYLFGTVSVVGPLANIILNFFISVVFSLGFVNTLIGFLFPAVAKAGAYIIDFLVGIIMSIVNTLASLPVSEIFTGEPVVLFMICFICFVVVYSILTGKSKLRIPFSLISVFIAFVCSFAVLNAEKSHMMHNEGIRFDVLDVGQGQCIIATSGDSCAVIDCGGDSPADRIAIAHLFSLGVSDIDALVLTHAHADHANGAEYLMKSVSTKAVYMPATDRENATFIDIADIAGEECDSVFVDEDTTIELEGMEIKLLTLPGGSDENENGLVVLVCDEEYELLITGDIATSNERLVLDRIPDCEGYIVGHHGSKTSSSQALLNRALPELSVISVGEGNSYGHPSSQAMKRLRNIGSEVRRTDTEGTLTFYSREKETEAE